ncbi:hypothetical protein LguiA_003326 [Lonicera macranthoides]
MSVLLTEDLAFRMDKRVNIAPICVLSNWISIYKAMFGPPSKNSLDLLPTISDKNISHPSPLVLTASPRSSSVFSVSFQHSLLYPQNPKTSSTHKRRMEGKPGHKGVNIERAEPKNGEEIVVPKRDRVAGVELEFVDPIFEIGKNKVQVEEE